MSRWTRSDQVLALGDGEVRVFTAGGEPVRQWPAGSGAECLTAGPDGRVYVGGAGRVDVFESGGRRVGGFVFGDAAKPPSVSAIAVHGPDILVADASARIIRRFDAAGRQRNLIGDQGKTKTFMLPNGSLDVDVDAAGVVRATDTGRHQVTSWALDGTPIGKFGKFGMQRPGRLRWLLQPVNVAATPDGKVVTAEKMVARVKVFEPDGRLLAVIGTEHFDPMCTQIHLAVDSKGRILAADPGAARGSRCSRPARRANRARCRHDRTEHAPPVHRPDLPPGRLRHARRQRPACWPNGPRQTPSTRSIRSSARAAICAARPAC